VFADIPWYLWFACIGIGLSYLYTAFFACFVFSIATVLRYWIGRDRRTLLLGLVLIGLTCAAAIADMSPSILFWLKHGTNPSMDFKYPAEAEIYGLKLRFLLTPTPEHPITLFRQIADAFKKAHFPFDTENESARLGTIGSIGFLTLLGISLAGGLAGYQGKTRPQRLLAVCAALSLACVLLATVGGFADFFNTFVAPDVRCYNRIAPFISFFSIVAVSVIIQAAYTKWASAPFAKTGLVILLGAVVSFAAVDQPVTLGWLPHSFREQSFRSDGDFVRQIEARMPAEAPIFQLPHAEFPVEQLRERMFNNDHGRPYIHAAKTRWSWGAVSGTTPAELNKALAALAIPEMVHRLAHHGYLGVWIDLFGYIADQSPEAALTTVLGTASLRSANGRYLFFDLRPYVNRMNTSEKAINTLEMRRLHPVEITYERGLYSAGLPAGVMWSTGRHGRIVLINPLNTSRSVTVSAVIRTGASATQKLKLTERSATEDLTVASARSYSRQISLPGKSLIPIDLDCACNAFIFKGQPKPFYFGIENLLISE
jgi:phosphoglycerol transferase